MEMRHFKSLTLFTEKYYFTRVPFKHYQQKINLPAPMLKIRYLQDKGHTLPVNREVMKSPKAKILHTLEL